MAAAKPRIGTLAKIVLTPAGGTAITLKNSDWSLDASATIKEAPNTSDGMIRVAGLADYKGSFKGFADSDQPIEKDVVPGTLARLQLFRSAVATDFLDGDVILDTLKITTGVADDEKWEATFSKASGTLYNPTSPRPAVI